MTDHLTLSGRVVTTPRFLRTEEGLAVCSFRLSAGWTRRPGERGSGPERNGYSVTALRQLAEHAYRSLHTGDRVLLTGRLRLRPRLRPDRGADGGIIAEVEAIGIGIDLRWTAVQVERVPENEPVRARQAVPAQAEGSSPAGGAAEVAAAVPRAKAS